MVINKVSFNNVKTHDFDNNDLPKVESLVEFNGKKYKITHIQLVEKSNLRKFADYLLGSVLTICSFSLLYFFNKNVRGLFEKNERIEISAREIEIVHSTNTLIPTQKVFEKSYLIRTYTLELLTIIEDLSNSPEAKNDITVLKELTDKTRKWLVDNALIKDCPVEDYELFLEELKIDTNKIEEPQTKESLEKVLSQCKDFDDGLLLDEKFSKDLFKKPSGWQKIRHLISARRFKDIHSKPIFSKEVRLPIPQFMLDIHAVKNHINMLKPEYREAAKWLYRHLQIFRFSDLCKSLQQSCRQISDVIRSWDDYAVINIPGKSQGWLPFIAQRFLPHNKPPKLHTIENNAVGGLSDSKFLSSLLNSSTKHFIMFDDACYSGNQLEAMLKNLFDFAESKKVSSDPITLHVIVGAIREGTRERLASSIERLRNVNVHVELLSQKTFPNIKILEEKEKVSENLAKAIEELTGGNYHCLFVTEWKTPDWMSLPIFFEGAIFFSTHRFAYDGMTNEEYKKVGPSRQQVFNSSQVFPTLDKPY